MKLKQALILGFCAGISGTLITNLFFQREDFNEQIIVNSLVVAITMGLTFLTFFIVKKKNP